MSFRPETRNWWMRVAGNMCQAEIYAGEERGWIACGKPAKHVHHIVPEGWQLEQGDEPEHSLGLPLCKDCHESWKGTNEPLEWTRDFSFHPDMGQNLVQYGEWKRQDQHMRSITGGKGIESDFVQTARAHREKARKGERYWAGTPEVDQYYAEKMKIIVYEYSVLHPEDPKPDLKNHPLYDPSRKKHWSSGLFDR